MFEEARARYQSAVDALVPLTVAMAFARTREALPGATVLETQGEVNEDGVPILRIRRVLGRHGEALYDRNGATGDELVDERLDDIGANLLDLLLDLTGAEYLGPAVLELDPPLTTLLHTPRQPE